MAHKCILNLVPYSHVNTSTFDIKMIKREMELIKLIEKATYIWLYMYRRNIK